MICVREALPSIVGERFIEPPQNRYWDGCPAKLEPYLRENGQTVSFCTSTKLQIPDVPDSTDRGRRACDDQPVHPELISTAIRARLGAEESVGAMSEVGSVISIGDG